jgi:type I restriction enzyme, S subunit
LSWPRVRLVELLLPVSRPVPVEPGKAYRLLGAQWYAKGLFLRETKDGSEIRARTLFEVREGDFVYNRLFAWKGSFAVATEADEGCFVSNEFPCFAVCSEVALPRWIQLYFAQETVWQEALGLSSGGTPTSRNRLKEERLLEMEIPLPPLPEQRRIVRWIEQIAAKVAEATRLREQAAEEVDALMTAGRRAIFGASLSDGWLRLGTYVTEIENGWSPACESRRAEANEWGVLKVGAVSFGVFDPAQNKALPLHLNPKPAYEVHTGDLLMSRANTIDLVGASAVVMQTPPRLILSDKIFRLKLRKDSSVDVSYLVQALKSPGVRSQIEQAATGTSSTMKNISKEKVLELLIPPQESLGKGRIVSYLERLESRVTQVRALVRASKFELSAIVPAALACELR